MEAARSISICDCFGLNAQIPPYRNEDPNKTNITSENGSTLVTRPPTSCGSSGNRDRRSTTGITCFPPGVSVLPVASQSRSCRVYLSAFTCLSLACFLHNGSTIRRPRGSSKHGCCASEPSRCMRSRGSSSEPALSRR